MKSFKLICLFSLLLSGCGEEPKPDTVFIVVNGVPITESQVRESVLIQAKIRELAGRGVPKNEFAKWANGYAMGLIGSLANAELLQAEIRRKGVKPEEEDSEKVLAAYNWQTGKDFKSVDELTEAFGELGPALRGEFAKTAASCAYARRFWTTEVSDDMVRQFCQIRTNELNRAKRINADAAQRAAKAYARLKAGESWAKVAAECSDDRFGDSQEVKYAEKWITVNEDAFRMRELAALLPKMKDGDYTPPIDTKFGLLIVRLNKRDRRLHQLSRILFRMAKDVKLPLSPDDVRKEMSAKWSRKAQERTMRGLEAAAKFEYPLGTNFTYRIWEEGK